MSLTYGFYDSVDNDRTYNAKEFGSMFDGVIVDGIFSAVGSAFSATAGPGLAITVRPGRAWFDHTWINLDANEIISFDEADPSNPRLDLVVLETNATTRENSIKVIKGTSAANPTVPNYIWNTMIHQYPLYCVRINAAATSVTITTDYRGRNVCPYASIVKHMNNSYVSSFNGETGDVVANVSGRYFYRDGVEAAPDRPEPNHWFRLEHNEEVSVNDHGKFEITLNTGISDIKAILINSATVPEFSTYANVASSLISAGGFSVLCEKKSDNIYNNIAEGAILDILTEGGQPKPCGYYHAESVHNSAINHENPDKIIYGADTLLGGRDHEYGDICLGTGLSNDEHDCSLVAINWTDSGVITFIFSSSADSSETVLTGMRFRVVILE